MRIGAVLLVTGSLLVTSCAATTTFVREPAGDGDTLVLGRVLFDCQLTRTGSVPIGKYRYGVELEFEDPDTGVLLKARGVDTEGFFFFHNPRSRRLRLVRLSYHSGLAQPELHPQARDTKRSPPKSSRGASAAMRPFRARTYEIRGNRVNNLGHLVWTGDMASRAHTITFNQEYAETRARFAERYPDSLWIRKDWVEIRSK